jgi:hypothetical protein
MKNCIQESSLTAPLKTIVTILSGRTKKKFAPLLFFIDPLLEFFVNIIWMFYVDSFRNVEEWDFLIQILTNKTISKMWTKNDTNCPLFLTWNSVVDFKTQIFRIIFLFLWMYFRKLYKIISFYLIPCQRTIRYHPRQTSAIPSSIW